MSEPIKLPPLPDTEYTLAVPAAPYEPAWISSMEAWDESAMENYATLSVEQATAELRAERDALRLLAERVNSIRNSIVGAQAVNFSEHVYPLVAALNEAGFAGMDYNEARKNLSTLIEQVKKAEAERDALRADAERYRWLASRARKETSYDRYGNGALWRIGFAVDDSRHALDAVIDAALKEAK